jgi:hypothetical protein
MAGQMDVLKALLLDYLMAAKKADQMAVMILLGYLMAG